MQFLKHKLAFTIYTYFRISTYLTSSIYTVFFIPQHLVEFAVQ